MIYRNSRADDAVQKAIDCDVITTSEALILQNRSGQFALIETISNRLHTEPTLQISWPDGRDLDLLCETYFAGDS